VNADPLVTVVIPTFDRAHCVTDAVDSVLAQTHSAIECVVVDDGSRDDTVAVLHTAFAGDRRVHVLACEHAGVSAARNRGIAQAAGEYVTFLDSDDLMFEPRVERQLTHLRDTGVDAVLCQQRSELRDGAPAPEWADRHPEWWTGPYHTSVLLAREHAERIGGFDETIGLGEDIDFVARLVGAGLRLGTVDEVLMVRRFFGDNLTYLSTDGDYQAVLGAVRRHRARRRSEAPTPGDGP
jgi:glycosyltransferase involved in cell wall biosynthesis